MWEPPTERREVPVRMTLPGVWALMMTGFDAVPSAWIFNEASGQVPSWRMRVSPAVMFWAASANAAASATGMSLASAGVARMRERRR